MRRWKARNDWGGCASLYITEEDWKGKRVRWSVSFRSQLCVLTVASDGNFLPNRPITVRGILLVVGLVPGLGEDLRRETEIVGDGLCRNICGSRQEIQSPWQRCKTVGGRTASNRPSYRITSCLEVSHWTVGNWRLEALCVQWAMQRYTDRGCADRQKRQADGSCRKAAWLRDPPFFSPPPIWDRHQFPNCIQRDNTEQGNLQPAWFCARVTWCPLHCAYSLTDDLPCPKTGPLAVANKDVSKL